MKKYNAPKMVASEANMAVTGACGKTGSTCGKYVRRDA